MSRAAALGAAAIVAFVVLPTTAGYADVSITSAGPLTNITISPDLNCAVNHAGDSAGEFYGNTACGTLIAVGGTLYGPAVIPAGGNAAPRTTYTAVSQTGPTGAGTSASPFLITTVVDLGTTGIRLTELDSYVVGEEAYRTTVTLQNTSGASISPIIYRAGDCYLQDTDNGIGAVNAVPAGNAVSCVNPMSSRIEQWYPLTPGSSYMEDRYSTVWARIGSQQPFPNTCTCPTELDNGAGLSWSPTIGNGASASVSHLTVFSPLGIQPLSTAKTADAATAPASSSDGYTITISNPNVSIAAIDAITDTLPAGFTYTPGSSSGATTSDPSISSQTLTWTGPFNVPAASGGTPGTLSLHFGVTVSSTLGTYTNDASGVSGSLTIVGTGPTAPIEVTQAVSTSSSSTSSTSPTSTSSTVPGSTSSTQPSASTTTTRANVSNQTVTTVAVVAVTPRFTG